jgi:thiamine biosynthesis lipoprotein
MAAIPVESEASYQIYIIMVGKSLSRFKLTSAVLTRIYTYVETRKCIRRAGVALALFTIAAASLPVDPVMAYQDGSRLLGRAMGTTYEVVYSNESADSVAIRVSIDSLLLSLTDVFSTYDPNSTLSKINASRDTSVSHIVRADFETVFSLAREIHMDSDKTFNPAIGPLTLAWGIAATAGDLPDEERLVRLRTASNMNHFHLIDGTPKRIRKSDPEAALDFNGIAKGYAVDKMFAFLRSKGLDQFLVELGGEIRTSGSHPDGRAWQIAVEYPSAYDSKAQTVLSVSDASVATSGNYRSVRYVRGRKIVHTIEPRSGLPKSNDLLSVTLIADDCATADAYATALMVMGSKRAITFLADRPHLDAYLMIGQDSQDFEIYLTPGIKQRLVNN